jgi:lipoate-protein ligase B
MNPEERRSWHAADLGRVPYAEAWDLQLRLVEARCSGKLDHDTVLFLEHPAVFTLGKRGGREGLLVSEEVLTRSGIDIVKVERGGVITYHGPGQLVAYPIIHLEKAGLAVVDMVDRLEAAMIRTCGAWGIGAERNPRNRGVWVGPKKIGSIGLAVRRGVSFHGMALNVTMDLTHFRWIQPCGLAGVGMTSMHLEIEEEITLADVRSVLAESMEAVFGIRLTPAPREAIFPRS